MYSFQRSYTLSRASGKKAAKFIFESYPQLFEKPLFMNDPAEPLPKVSKLIHSYFALDIN